MIRCFSWSYAHERSESCEVLLMLPVLRIISAYLSPEGPVVVEVEYVAELMDYDIIDHFLRSHGKTVIESELSE